MLSGVFKDNVYQRDLTNFANRLVGIPMSLAFQSLSTGALDSYIENSKVH